MAKNLVIVESPAKAKKISTYLGRDYVVKSSFGHVRDLPTGGDAEADPADRLKAAREAKAKGVKVTPAQKAKKKLAALIRRMGVDPDNGWAATYEIVPGKQKIIDELSAAAEKAEKIWLASDLDREGEAIAWHLKECLGGPDERFARVTFNEITKSAIQESFKNPGHINQDRVNAQQARRFLDRVVGFQVSPLLWSKVARGLSAGRVQSVAVRLVVDREREIKAFKPDEYWELHADLDAKAGHIRAQVVKHAGAKFEPTCKAHADTAVAALAGATWRLTASDRKPAKSYPSPPFITSSLQVAASIRLGFSVKKTMTLAQRLYEAGHITYMRTDSVNLSAQAVQAARELISSRFGAAYLPEKANAYTSKAGAQEAHEAIRPTDAAIPAAALDAEADAQRLYDLIWRQFVACQMPPAEFDTTVATITAADYEAVARGRVLRFDGFFKVQPPAKSDDVVLPELTVGETLKLAELLPTQHFTKPPARFSEASLVREMEKRGIGRPSTYASIISTIQDRGYARLDARRFRAEKLGEIVTDRLVAAFPDLLDFGFTAGMELDLDKIADAQADWKKTLDAFYKGFKRSLATAESDVDAVQPVPTSIACPTCSRPMAVKFGRTGVFLTCSGYGLPPKERCTKTLNLVPGAEAEVAKPADEGQSEGENEETQASEAEAFALHTHRRCPKCGTAMDAWLVDEKRQLHLCGNSPNCPGIEVEEGQFKLKGYDGPSIPCDKCGKPMQLKTGRFGKYFGCTAWPECTNTRKLLRSGQPAPPKIPPVETGLKCTKADDVFVLRDGAAGLFLSAKTYPRVRETRNPTVAELQAIRDRLPEKYHFIADGPATDPDGNPVLVRYAKKAAEHYLSSEKAGKPTGWTRHWRNGAWVEDATVAKR